MVIQLIEQFVIGIQPTGSNYICNPPVEDTDKDYIVLIQPFSMTDVDIVLSDDYWAMGGSVPMPLTDMVSYNGFISYKKDNINLIVTENTALYTNFVLATEQAKQLNLLDKQDRIDLFQKVLYGIDKGECE